MPNSSLPTLGALYLRVLMDRRPGELPAGASAGRLEDAAADIQVDPDRVAAYQEICGFRRESILPITYPHVLVAGLHMQMLLDPAFPVRLTGLVHLWNKITQHEPLSRDQSLSCRCWLEGSKPIDAGEEFCLHTEFRVGNELCWQEQTGFVALRKDRTRPPRDDAIEAAQYQYKDAWSAAGDIGRRYARVSGDYNPIHLSKLSARLFGFRLPIAHGMWTMARCVSALCNDTNRPMTLETRFLRPVSLPADVVLKASVYNRAQYFRLTDQDNRRVFLQGALETI